MIVQICSETDPGLARNQNEDSIAFDAATGLCILADGMGGHNAGEVASGMATAFIKSDICKSIVGGKSAKQDADALQQAIAQSIAMANSAIYNMSRTNPHYAGMGTTLVVGMFHHDVLVLAHIGDSRCYRVRDHGIQQLTKDHSVLQEQLEYGLAAAHHIIPGMGQNLVTRALGVGEQVQPEINRYDLVAGDIYLMCSDGLTDMVDDAAICAILLGPQALEQKAGQLVVAANESGGRDNISVLLAQVEEKPISALLGSAHRVIHGIWPAWKGRVS